MQPTDPEPNSTEPPADAAPLDETTQPAEVTDPAAASADIAAPTPAVEVPPVEPQQTILGKETNVVAGARQDIEQLARDLADPEFWLGSLQVVVLMLMVFAVTTLVIRLAMRIVNRLQRTRRLPETMMTPIRRFVRWGILLIALLLVLEWFGIQMRTVWASLSAIAALVAIGFVAVWSVLSNIACSVMLLIFKPFRIGDVIEFMDNPGGTNVGGRVKDLTLMYVVLREEGPDGATVQVPNNLFFQKMIRRHETARSVSLEDHIERHGIHGREESKARRNTDEGTEDHSETG